MKLRSFVVRALAIAFVSFGVVTSCGGTASTEEAKPAKPPLPTEITCQTAPEFEKIAIEYFNKSQGDRYVDIRAYYADIANMATNMARLGYEKCDNPK